MTTWAVCHDTAFQGNRAVYLVCLIMEGLARVLSRCFLVLSRSDSLQSSYHHLRPWAFIDVSAVFSPISHCSLSLCHIQTCSLSFTHFLSLRGGELLDTKDRSIFTPLFSVSLSLCRLTHIVGGGPCGFKRRGRRIHAE